MENLTNPTPLPRCDVCFKKVQSDSDLTMCMDCGRDYCPECGTPNQDNDAMGTCINCGRNKVGIV